MNTLINSPPVAVTDRPPVQYYDCTVYILIHFTFLIGKNIKSINIIHTVFQRNLIITLTQQFSDRLAVQYITMH
jgi:hypothetical protein